MPTFRCIDARGYQFTEGNLYEIDTTRNYTNESDEEFCYVRENDGTEVDCYFSRFEPVEENPVPQPTEPAQTQTWRPVTDISELSVGMQVRVRSNLRHICENEAVADPGYVNQMDRFIGQTVTIRSIGSYYVAIDNSALDWCPEQFEILASPVENTHDFKVGDIVIITKQNDTYYNRIAYIEKVTATSVKTNLYYGNYRLEDIKKVNEEEILNPVMEELFPNNYTQIPTADVNAIKQGVKVKIPTRKYIGGSLANVPSIEKALEARQDFLYITRNHSGSSTHASYDRNTNIYNTFGKHDLEILPTNFVVGRIEAGHRIKDDQGKTHTFEPYNETTCTLVKEDSEYIDYVDSTGWFIRLWKELVTKPRGTVEYTEYMAMTPEDYVAYKSQTEDRFNYIETEMKNHKIRERNDIKRQNKDNYNQVKLNAQAFIEQERQRIERERIAEESRRAVEELTKHGIWKHHVWN
jgi:hypothetical protein